jgi:hypothetical protein
LADTIAARLEVLLQQGKLAAFRQTLFGDSATPAVNERFAFSFKPESYPASRLYNGPYRFKKHFYPAPGDRMLVVEYKGAHLLNDPKTVEKRDVGEVWARSSQKRCVFVMPTDEVSAGKSVTDQIRKALKQK